MAKFLTLNTHSLLGENVEEKLKILGDEIFSGDYDVVCLQEVNQLMTSDTTKDLPGYCPVAGEIAIHEDNYGLQLARYLAQKGTTYYWSYAYNHVGYDRFNEGVAIFSKEPLEASCSFQKAMIHRTIIRGRCFFAKPLSTERKPALPVRIFRGSRTDSLTSGKMR